MLRLTKSDVFLLRTDDDPPSKQVGERKLKDLKSKLFHNSVMIDGIEFFGRSLGNVTQQKECCSGICHKIFLRN